MERAASVATLHGFAADHQRIALATDSDGRLHFLSLRLGRGDGHGDHLGWILYRGEVVVGRDDVVQKIVQLLAVSLRGSDQKANWEPRRRA